MEKHPPNRFLQLYLSLNILKSCLSPNLIEWNVIRSLWPIELLFFKCCSFLFCSFDSAWWLLTVGFSPPLGLWENHIAYDISQLLRAVRNFLQVGSRMNFKSVPKILYFFLAAAFDFFIADSWYSSVIFAYLWYWSIFWRQDEISDERTWCPSSDVMNLTYDYSFGGHWLSAANSQRAGDWPSLQDIK